MSTLFPYGRKKFVLYSLGPSRAAIPALKLKTEEVEKVVVGLAIVVVLPLVAGVSV